VRIGKAVVFAIVASSALPLGAWIGARRPPSRAVTAALLAFASGALITAVAFELFEDAFAKGGAWRAGIAFFAGATVFIVVDTWLDRRTEGRQAAGERWSAPGRTRTCDPRLRRPLLYPAELPGRALTA
jgi:zinc transporter, ZIP family